MLIKQILLWEDSASAKSGTILLNESSDEIFIEIEDLGEE